MSHSFNLSCVADLREQLNQHPIYRSLRDLNDVRGFMSQHIYSVWDFMSLAKTLQQAVAPAGAPWVPVGNPALRRFINEIVLEEESDEGLPDASGQKTYLSHFELYCQAMREIGANDGAAQTFKDRRGAGDYCEGRGSEDKNVVDDISAGARNRHP